MEEYGEGVDEQVWCFGSAAASLGILSILVF